MYESYHKKMHYELSSANMMLNLLVNFKHNFKNLDRRSLFALEHMLSNWYFRNLSGGWLLTVWFFEYIFNTRPTTSLKEG